MNMNPPLAIRIIGGPGAGQIFPLKGSLFIGSGTQSEIRITGPGVSALHARIDLRGNAYTLVDLMAVPLVKVNGHLIKSRKLALHDQIAIGDVTMEVVEPGEAAVSPPPQPPELVLVGTEPSSKTAEMEELAAEEEVEPVEEKKVYRQPQRVPSRHPQYYRPEVAIRQKQSAGNQVARFVIIAIMLIAVLVIVGLLWQAKQVSDRAVRQIYQEAVDFARAHPNDLEEVIRRYQQAQRDCASHPELGRFFAGELERLKAQQAKKQHEVAPRVE